jgi:hypothetical protein
MRRVVATSDLERFFAKPQPHTIKPKGMEVYLFAVDEPCNIPEPQVAFYSPERTTGLQNLLFGKLEAT